MRSSSGAAGSVARGTPEGKALNFSTSGMFLIAAINLYRISAADTSRLVKFALSHIVAGQARRNSADVITLLRKLDGVGPAFCGMALDHAPNLVASIPLIHAELPVVQERQADNMATLLAGYWVALNRRSISAAEVMGFVEPFVSAVEEQREGVELDDATECLNVLLGTSVFVTLEETNNEGDVFSHKETMPLGTVIASVFNAIARVGSGWPHWISMACALRAMDSWWPIHIRDLTTFSELPDGKENYGAALYPV